MLKTVLVVDDSAVERVVLEGFLKDEYCVETVSGVDEMMSFLNKAESEVSAIVLDMVMPETDGFEVLRKIRENPIYSQLPIIAATALSDEESQVKAMSLGANGYVIKPFNRQLLLYTIKNAINLREKSVLTDSFRRDALTGLLNRNSFFDAGEEMLNRKEAGYYVFSSCDIENFKLINNQYGIDKGDKVLKSVAEKLGKGMDRLGGICCRYAADKFGLMYPAKYMFSEEMRNIIKDAATGKHINHSIKIRIGLYLADDLSVPVSAMFDRATLAEESIRGKYDEFVAVYSDSMLDSILNEQKIVNDMDEALKNNEFEPWFQPQYNHATGALVGAEALVRWRRNGEIIPPKEYVPVFERNGFIYEMDKYIWEKVASMLRKWIDEGDKPLPVSINISRVDLFHDDITDFIENLVEKYNIPKELFRLEVTESAFAEATRRIISKTNNLIEKGFTVEIDDFGSGYSSLNTLKDVSASILKLDMRFFENTKNSQRGGNIIESVVRMAKWLGMAVIAEGVEESEQADYLKSIGCYYIQGFFYAKPMPAEDYTELLRKSEKEPELTRLRTLRTLDNNEFWNPKSMETLIFNSYVGGACIFEYHDGKSEILRFNERFIKELGGLISEGVGIKDTGITGFMTEQEKEKVRGVINNAVETQKETSCDVTLSKNEGGKIHTEYLRVTVREIARTADRNLIYCVAVNTTEKHLAEEKALNASERIAAVMNNSQCGITSVTTDENGRTEFLFINDRFYEMFGYTKEQFDNEITDPFCRIVPEDAAKVTEKMKNLKKIGDSENLQMRAERRDGRIIWVRCDISIVKFANIPTLVQLSSFLDITEQVETEKLQLESARQLEVIMNNVNGGVSAVRVDDNEKTEFIFANEKYFELYGYIKKEADREHIDASSLILPEDYPKVMEKVRQLKKDRKPVIIDYRIRKHGGELAFLQANASLMYMEGYGEVITSVITDITEKRELADRFEAVVNNINGGVSAYRIVNGEISLEVVNDRYFKIIGYTREQIEEDKKKVFDLLYPEDRERVVKQVFEAGKHQGNYSMEYRIVRRDGEIRNILCNTNVMHLAGIDELVQLSVTNDITELRKAQKRENETEGKLSAVLNHAGNGITAMALHENKPKFIFANDRFFEIVGYSREKYLEKTKDNLFVPIAEEDRERVLKEVLGTKENGKNLKTEFRVIREDGKKAWVRAVITITSLPGYNVPVQIGMFSDITDEKETSEQLRFLNDSAHDILSEADSEKAINKTLDNLRLFFEGDRAYVVELDYEKQVENNTYEVCSEGVESEIEMLKNVPLDISTYWFEALQKNEFVSIEDVSALDDSKKDLREILLRQNISSLIIAPIFRNGILYGYTGIDNPKKGLSHIDRMRALADYIAVLLNRRDLEDKIEHENSAILQLMNDTPGGFVRMKMTEQGTFIPVYSNEGMTKLFGMSKEELHKIYGDNVLNGVYPEDREIIVEAGRKMVLKGSAQSARFRVNNGTGECIWLSLYGRTAKGDDGNTYMNVYYSDVTEQVSEEKKQRELLDNIPCGASLYEFNGKDVSVIHINKKYWELVEREPTDYSKTSVFNMIHKDDIGIVKQEIEAAIRQKRNIDVDMRIRCGEKGYKPFHVSANITDQKNGKYLLFCAYTPISEQTMSVQEMIPVALSTMMSTSDDFSFVLDKDLRYICCSHSNAQILGLESERDIIGMNDYDLFDRELAEKFRAEDMKVMETGEPMLEKDECLNDVKGNNIFFKASKYPIMDSSGNVIGLYGISRDITAQKEKESQLKLLNDSIPGGLAEYRINDDGIEMVYFNDGFYSFSGYSREEYQKIIEKDPLALVYDEDKPLIHKMIEGFRKNKIDGHTNGCSFRCHTRDGGFRWMSMRSILQKTGDDQFMVNVVQLDITEQKEAENKQKELLDNLPCGAGLYNFDGETLSGIHYNKRFLEMVGRGPDYDHNTLAIKAVHPDDRQTVFEAIQKNIDNISDGELCAARICHADGSYHPYKLYGRFLYNQDGKYSACVIFFPIPEEQMIMQQMLPLVFPAMMESSTDIAFAKDKNFRYLCCSRTYAKILGLSNEKSVVGKTDYELFSDEIAESFRSDDLKLVAEGKPIIDKTETIPSGSGLPYYTRISKYLLKDTSGNVLGIYGIGRDITERRETRDHLKLLTDTIPGGLVTFACTKNDYRLEYFNDGFCNLFGYSRDEFNFSMADIIDFIVENDRQMVINKIAELVAESTPIDLIYKIHTKGGSFRWVNHKAIVVDRVGEEAIISAIFLDVTEQQEEKERLRVSEELNRIAIQHSGNIITRFDVGSKTLSLPEILPEIFALPRTLYNVPEEQIALGRISPDTADIYRKLYSDIANGAPFGTATYRQNSEVGWRWLEAQFTTVFSSTGEAVYAVISFTDVTEELEKEVVYNKWQQSLNDREEKSYALFRSNLSKDLSYDSWEGKLLNVKFKKGKHSFSERAEEYVSQCVLEEDIEKFNLFVNTNSLLAEYYRGHRSDSIEFREKLMDGGYRWLRLNVDLVEYPSSKDIEIYMMFEDIDEQKKAELLTIERSETDPLTGVLNRIAFISKMNDVLEKTKGKEKHALLMLDIDNFKNVNDSLGHGAGDKVLCELTAKIKNILRHDDLIGRLGGDEFFVLLKGIPNDAAAEIKAQRICSFRISVEGAEMPVTTSIGIAMIPKDGENFDELYKKVDKALYQQKEHGKNGYKFVDE